MSLDIRKCLCQIKGNIALVEKGNDDPSILDDISADFLSLLELIKLFLISERDSYYGYFLMNLRFQVNFRSNSIAGIKLDTFPAVLEANPLLLCKFTLKEILYVICHEIDHLVLNHPALMIKSNPQNDPDIFYQFNLAADASVNDRINNEIVEEKRKFLSAPEGIITSSSLKKMFRLRNVEPLESYAYYFELIKKGNQSSNKDFQNGQSSMMSAKGSKEKSKENNNSLQDKGKQEEAPFDNKKIITANNYEELQDHEWVAGEDVEHIEVATRELVNSVVDMMNEETRGMMPAHFMHQVKNLNEPAQLSWQAVLKKYIGTISANKRKTRMRLNRRQPDRFDLSGTVDDKILKIVVAIDTSGSVSNKMISQIFNEIFSILAKRKHEITVIECDATVQRVYKAKNASQIKTKIAGRGGTWFTPVIEYVNKDKYFRDALLIYFTDGFGENTIPKPLTYRNIWVVLGDARNLSVKEPYGVVLTL